MEKSKAEVKIRKAFWDAVEEFSMIEPGDKIMVCLSGGKDSYTMLEMFSLALKARQNNFEIIAVNLDQKQPGFPEETLPAYFKSKEIPFRIVEADTYSIVKEKVPVGKTMCSLCSRLRRGILYDVATEMGITKIALGHHREDLLETFLLNLFFAGKIETMPAKYKTDDGRHIVIRPMAYCAEADIAEFANEQKFPIIPCNLCGSQEGMQRAAMKKMLADWEEKFPGRKSIMLTALKNIHPSHLLDKSKFDFDGIMSGILTDTVNNLEK